MTLIDNPPSIEILPEHIIDQIKAGEVLERPASLIKELIENSLDARSTEINIHLVENGMDLLSIEDNGIGMDFKNLPFAFLRHATSKLRNYEDLYRLRSFGFRGEALASVAASSRLTCTTQPKDLAREGGKIVISGGETQLLVPQQASSQGTSLFIKDLFYNTPARLKFVKSKVSEKAALKKMLYSFVLSHPTVNFSIKWDDKEKEIFKAVPADDQFTRVSQVFFGKKTNEVNRLFESSEEYDGYKVKVFFTPDTYTTPQYRHHYLFANKRFFQDKSIHSAVLRNLDSLWRFGESGHYIVDITTPAEELDVNVHPNKTQIKFMRMDVIYSLLVTSLKNAIKNQMPAAPALLPEKVPGTFFSQEENQSFDLMHFASSGEDTGPAEYIARPFGDNTVQSTSNSTYLKISPQFIIDQSVRPNQLIDCKKMVAIYLTKNFFAVVNTSEAPTPLLISEPFQIKDKAIDKYFETLKTFGLEFDRLNTEFIVLRTIPRFLPNAWVVDSVDALLNFLLTKKNLEPNTLQQFFETEIADQILDEISPTLVEQMMRTPECSTFVCELKDSLLKSLFKQI